MKYNDPNEYWRYEGDSMEEEEQDVFNSYPISHFMPKTQ
jgi:hypothetical protein